ncbi:MAG: helix-turn-helix transcriptional regulator [Rhizobiales bacterium]|nr:helix-turn-helix transcriptional regulator [Hyphomicrobiales bacterium]
MDSSQVPFGLLLRRWRTQRRMLQSDLAMAAETSARHLSCLETCKAQPSREMVIRLAEYLDIPLRDRNTLLLAAGFAPSFTERSVVGLEAAKTAIDSVLQAHKPYPAFAVDRRWNVVSSNAALPQLYEGCAEDLMRSPVNAVRLILHPAGMGPRVLNYAAWRAHTLGLLRQQLQTRVDPVIKALADEIAAYPIPAHSEPLDTFNAAQSLATPLRVATRLGVVTFLNTITVFGSPHDVTLSELALEMLFPADEGTVEIVRTMVAESAAAAGNDVASDAANADNGLSRSPILT